MVFRPETIAQSHLSQSAKRNDVCYNSFLAVAAELYRNDSVYVVAKPCSKVRRSPSATQFGVFRIR